MRFDGITHAIWDGQVRCAETRFIPKSWRVSLRYDFSDASSTVFYLNVYEAGKAVRLCGIIEPSMRSILKRDRWLAEATVR